MVNMSEYARPVHRSLMQRDLLAGIPTAGVVLIILLTAIFVLGLEMYFMLIPIVIIYIIMRALTKRDPWLIDIVLENIMQKERFIP
jgi:type IV secretory pathway TrbD component